MLPKEDALKFMKEAAYKSFAKKGDAIVEMNYKAIDAGFDAFVKIDVPASWADANDAEGDHELAGNPATVKMVKEILFPATACLFPHLWTMWTASSSRVLPHMRSAALP